MIYIIDDFYPNPDEVRKNALKMQFKRGKDSKGKVQHPGWRANTNLSLDPFWRENRMYLRNRWSQIINKEIWAWEKMHCNCAFNLGFSDLENRFSWVHSDNSLSDKAAEKIIMWACVIYLTPNPPPKTGTLLLESPESGIWDMKVKDQPKDKRDKYFPAVRGNFWDNPVALNKEWKVHTIVGNRYNRCVFYDARLLHAPEDAGFGKTLEEGRLTQLGFWFSEKNYI